MKNAINTTENPEAATMDMKFDECLYKEVRRCLHLYNLSLKKYKDVFFVLQSRKTKLRTVLCRSGEVSHSNFSAHKVLQEDKQ